VAIVIAPHNQALDDPDPRFAVLGSGAKRKSPFQLAQEFLNASPGHEWALVSNGRTLRLLRDAATLTRPSYLEVDLQDLLAGQRFVEFGSAWRLLHASRAGLLDVATEEPAQDRSTRGVGQLAASRAGRRHPRARGPAPGRHGGPH
jgi:hypothetical protein